MLCLLEHPSYRGRQPRPVIGLYLQLLPPGCSQLIESRPPPEFRNSPFRLDPSLMFKAMERRIQRTLVHLQYFSRNLLDPFRNRPPVHGAGLEGTENQEIERALQKIEP